MLYTRKGDEGNTKLFNCPQGVNVKKSAKIFEALGTIDELNSTLGYLKVLSQRYNIVSYLKNRQIKYEEVIEKIQHMLFIIQAELGGSEISVTLVHIKYLEDIIYEIETLLPPINSFVLPGGTEVGAFLDIARTVARRGERQVVALMDTKEKEVSKMSIMFLNRLSSVMYAMARFANYQSGYMEIPPYYK